MNDIKLIDEENKMALFIPLLIGFAMISLGLLLGFIGLMATNDGSSAVLFLPLLISGILGTAVTFGIVYAFEKITERGMSDGPIWGATLVSHVLIISTGVWILTREK